jgi:hypothetical protein
MAVDATTPRSRRALLVGAVGGLAAMAATMLGRPGVVSAADPNDVVLGALNESASATRIRNTTADDSTAKAIVGIATGPGIGVEGRSDESIGVHGTSGDGGIGVRGTSTVGVEGLSETAGLYGVGGFNSAADGFGIWGEANGAAGRGVYGTVSGQQGVGVWGVSAGAAGIGVVGESLMGRGGRFKGS